MEDRYEDDMLLGAIDRPGQKDWSTTVTINSQNVRFKLDTGAQCNIMSLETYNRYEATRQHFCIPVCGFLGISPLN